MKWTYTIKNKLAASGVLFSLCLLVLFSNYIDRNHTENVKNAISTLYEDRLIALGKEFSAKGVGFLLINSNDPNQNEEENLNNMKNRAKEKGYPFVYLQDDQQTVAKMFGAQKNPEVFLLKGNQISYKGAIDNNPLMPEKADRQYLRDALLAVLSGKTPTEVSVPANGCNIKWR